MKRNAYTYGINIKSNADKVVRVALTPGLFTSVNQLSGYNVEAIADSQVYNVGGEIQTTSRSKHLNPSAFHQFIKTNAVTVDTINIQSSQQEQLNQVIELHKLKLSGKPGAERIDISDFSSVFDQVHHKVDIEPHTTVVLDDYTVAILPVVPGSVSIYFTGQILTHSDGRYQ